MLTRFSVLFVAVSTTVFAQLTPNDTLFAGLSARSRQLVYQSEGRDMTAITPLMSQQNYRSLTHAMVLMSGLPWTPDNELPTALDFGISAKLVGSGESLAARATFVFDAPAAANGPYRMRLDLLKADGTKEASADPGVTLGDVRGRHTGEMIGFTFNPSAVVQPGLHTVRATLEDGKGTKLFEYYRTVCIVPDLNKRVAALEKTLELLPDQKSLSALEAREVLEEIGAAHAGYHAAGFQNLTGYVFTGMRAAGLGLDEPLDFEAGLTRATLLATSAREGQDTLATARGDLALAYRSTFDGKLVPYRVYVPTNYDKSKKYPLVVLLHGAGGSETDFVEAYQKLWPKLAEERGYILASVNGRGPVSGYSKESGGEQDVFDVTDLVMKRYSVDPAKVYLGGHSMGGGGTWRLGLANQDKFAGFIPIAPAGNNPALMSSLKKPTMLVCGAKDALVPVAGCRAVAAKAKELNAPVKYSEYADGDHLTVAVMAVPDIFKWLDEQTKGTVHSATGGR
jgi:poly(3-hydroxybutyrate) depolymerase